MITTIFDTETTGLIKPTMNRIEDQPYITEIYCLKVDQAPDGNFTIMDEFESFFKVPHPLSMEITKITGITDAMLETAPTFANAYEELAEFFTGVDRMVAHNMAFDRSMLANELVRIDKVIKFPWARDQLCTVEKTMNIEQRRMSLTNLHKHLFGHEFPNAHRAKSDVLPLYECYKELCKRGYIK